LWPSASREQAWDYHSKANHFFKKTQYYQLEAVNEGWTKRQLERQINSLLYERLLKSNDKEKVLAVARGELFPSLSHGVKNISPAPTA